MARITYNGEFEINASKRMLFPYLSTAAGLAEWFADDVNISPKKEFVFEWDGEKSTAKVISQNKESTIKFDFGTEEGESKILEFTIDVNELTQTVYIRVTDSTADIEDEEEFHELWENLIYDLKELVGG